VSVALTNPDGFGSEKEDKEEWQQRRCGEQHRVSKHVRALMSELHSRLGIPDRPGCWGTVARSNHGVDGIPNNGRAVGGHAAEEKCQRQAFVGQVIDGERPGDQRDQRKLHAAEQLAVELIMTINNAAQTRRPLPNQVKAVAVTLLDLPVRAGAQDLFCLVSGHRSSAGLVPVIHNDGRLGIGTVSLAVP